MARTSQLRLTFISSAMLIFLGCPGDEPVEPPPSADAGHGNVIQDTGSMTTDAGGSTTADAGIAARSVQPSTALTAGGGIGENANYKVRLLIGGPTAAGVGSNGSNSVKVGAGAAQNGQ